MTRDPEERENLLDDTRMTFGEHLEELRSRLIRAILGTVVTFIVAFSVADELMALVTRPYRSVTEDLRLDASLKIIAPGQGFFAYMQVCLVVGLIAAGPLWLYQLWRFIAVGLYPRERRWVYRYFPLAVFLFGCGVALGYLQMVPLGLRFLLTFADPALVQNWISLSDYLGFFATFTLLLGVAFELPVVMLVLSKVGIFSARAYASKRKFWILAAFVVAAVLTPPDPVSQLLLGLPLCFLYELGILLSWLAEGKARVRIPKEVLRKRLRFAAIAALVIFLVGRIALSKFEKAAADDRVFLPGEDDPIATLPVLASLLQGEKIAAAIRIEEREEREGDLYAILVARGDRDLAALWRVVDDLETAHPLPEKDGWRQALVGRGQFRFARAKQLLPPGTTGATGALPQIPGRELLPGLIEVFERASPDEQAFVRRFLEALAKERPEGASADESAATIAAWKRWSAENGSTPFPKNGPE